MIPHYAKLPDGTIVKRNSSRRFTHAVAMRSGNDQRWRVIGFCGSLARAEALARDAPQRYARQTQSQVNLDIKILRVQATP